MRLNFSIEISFYGNNNPQLSNEGYLKLKEKVKKSRSSTNIKLDRNA